MRSVEKIAEDIVDNLGALFGGGGDYCRANELAAIERLLLEFAAEIKRAAIEP